VDPWLGAATCIVRPLITGQVALPLTRCQCSMSFPLFLISQKAMPPPDWRAARASQNGEQCDEALGGGHGAGLQKATLFQALGRRVYVARWRPGLRNNVEAMGDYVTDHAEDLQGSEAKRSRHVWEGKAG
jgi:hypothetical protein